MGLYSQTVPVTTDASGDATEYSTEITGRLVSIRYVKTDYADTVDFTITTEESAENVWAESNVTASKIVRPTVLEQLQDGTNHTARRQFEMWNERLKFVLAQGGDTKSGAFIVVVDGMPPHGLV